jgi:AcrR family transcriptional regulator
MPEPTLTPLKAARREKLIDAAEMLFLAQGFRATTMEGIADAAGMSKVTVYGYFRDKDAAFLGVAQRLADRLRDVVLGELHGPGTTTERVTRALLAKCGLFYDTIRSSAFAQEIMAQKVSMASIIAELDRALTDEIAALLGEVQTARILFNAALGIAEASANKAEMQDDIAQLVQHVLG